MCTLPVPIPNKIEFKVISANVLYATDTHIDRPHNVAPRPTTTVSLSTVLSPRIPHGTLNIVADTP